MPVTMTTKPIHLSASLRSALAELNLTQQQFAKGAGISVPLITKIFRGDPVHRKSLKQVLQFFRERLEGSSAEKGRSIAAGLVTAYLKDMFMELGLDAPEIADIGLKPELLSDRDRAILSIFKPFQAQLLLALSCLGRAATANLPVRDSVYALADMSTSLIPTGFPKHHFRNFVERPAPPSEPGKGRAVHRLIGGSLGEIMMDLG